MRAFARAVRGPLVLRSHAVGHLHDVRHLADAVHPHDVRAQQDRTGHRGGGPPLALAGRARAQRLLEKRLARGADENRPVELRQGPQPREHGERLGRVLGEAEPGIDHHLFARDPGRGRAADCRTQLGDDLPDDVVVRGVAVHVAGPAAHVHEHERNTGGGADGRQVRIIAQPGDVVDEGGAVLDRPPGDLGLAGVDRDRHPQPPREAAQHRDDAPDLLVGRHLRGAGPGRLAAHVDDVRTVGLELQSRRRRMLGVRIRAAVGERIRGRVDDPHHERPLAQRQRPASGQAQRVACAREHHTYPPGGAPARGNGPPAAVGYSCGIALSSDGTGGTIGVGWLSERSTSPSEGVSGESAGAGASSGRPLAMRLT